MKPDELFSVQRAQASNRLACMSVAADNFPDLFTGFIILYDPYAPAPTASLRRVKLSQLRRSAAENCLCRKLTEGGVTVSCVTWVE